MSTLQEMLIYHFNVTKSVAEAHQMLSDASSEAAMSKRTCHEWYQCFKSGDFWIGNRHSGRKSKVFEDEKLEELLYEELLNSKEVGNIIESEPTSSFKSLKQSENDPKAGKYGMPYELKPKDVQKHLCDCELLERQKTERIFASNCDW